MMPSNKQGQLKETKVSEFEAIIGSKYRKKEKNQRLGVVFSPFSLLFRFFLLNLQRI